MDRKKHWENVYSSKSHLSVSWYQQKPETSLKLINQLQIKPDDKVIDVGGGASTLVDFLNNAGYKNITVLDISENALIKAQQRLGKEADKIEWCIDDIVEFSPDHKFMLWHDRAVFHFLTKKADRLAYINTLKDKLIHGGYFIIAAFSLAGPEKCSGLDIVQYDTAMIKHELGNNFKLLSEQKESHITPDNKLQEFVYYSFKYNG